MKNNAIMLGVFLMALLSIPAVMMVTGQLTDDRLALIGLHTNPNYNGGIIIARFDDPAGDLIDPVPDAFKGYKNAFDIRSFTVARVVFSRLSGMGIAPRLNLVFEFDGRLPDPYDSSLQFSLPAIQVFINAPDRSFTSPLLPGIALTGKEWDFQVCIDGLHGQARIYDTRGTLIGEGLSIAIKHITADNSDEISKTHIPDKRQEDLITSTSLNVALPLDLIGDPLTGAWEYYVVIGMPDLNSPGGISSSVFDCFKCSQRETDNVIALQPLRSGLYRQFQGKMHVPDFFFAGPGEKIKERMK